MELSDERIEVEIEFTQEGRETGVAELSDLLAQLERMYVIFDDNRNLLHDIVSYEMDEEVFYDEEARDTFVGRLYRYNILDQLEYQYRITTVPPRYADEEYSGLTIKRIRKESPLLISLIGGGTFAAVLWIIGGIEYEREVTERVDEDGDGFRKVESKLRFSATSTRDIISEIRGFLD